jgi:hypothetical protein
VGYVPEAYHDAESHPIKYPQGMTLKRVGSYILYSSTGIFSSVKYTMLDLGNLAPQSQSLDIHSQTNVYMVVTFM